MHLRVPTERETSGTLSNPSQTLTEIHTTPHGKITPTLGGSQTKTRPKTILPTHLIGFNPTVLPQTVPSTTILPTTMGVLTNLKD